MQRRLAAIMVADIVGYSSLMEEAEEQTADQVARCQELIREKVSALGGRVFNTAGDCVPGGVRQRHQCPALRDRNPQRAGQQLR